MTPDDREYLVLILNKIKDVGDNLRQPIDPKVEGCLELAFNCIVEQLECDREYEWCDIPRPHDKFYHGFDKDTPDATELEKWLE